MKRKSYRSGAALLMGGFFLFALDGCSTTLNYSSWSPFRGQEEGYFAGRKATQDSQAIYRLACAYQEKNQHQMALEQFKRVLQLDPGHAQSYNGMGISYDRLGNYSRALGCYTAALKINPDLDYVHNNMGYSYLLQGEAASAAAAFQKAIALNGTNDRYRNNLGVAYAQMGKINLALAEFKTTETETVASAPASPEKPEPQQVAGQRPDEKNSAPALTAIESPATDLAPEESATTAMSSPVAVEPEKKIASDPFQQHKMMTTKLPQDTKTKVALPVPDREDNRTFQVRDDKPKEQTVAKAEPAQSRTIDATSDHAVSASTAKSVSAVVSENRKTVSNPPAPAQQMIAAHKPLGQARVEVANGTGGKGVAAWWGNHLWQQGVTVASFSNAPVYTKTKIYYTEGHLQEAYQIAKIIPQYQEFERVAAFANRDIKIRVVIGRDVLRFTGKETEKKVLMAMAEF